MILAYSFFAYIQFSSIQFTRHLVSVKRKKIHNDNDGGDYSESLFCLFSLKVWKMKYLNGTSLRELFKWVLMNGIEGAIKYKEKKHWNQGMDILKFFKII